MECRINVEKAPAQIPRGNTDGRRVKNRPPALFARAQRRLGLELRGDIDIDRLEKGRSGLTCRHQSVRDVQPHRGAVFSDVLFFNVALGQRASPVPRESLSGRRTFVRVIEFEDVMPNDLVLAKAEHPP